MKPMISIREEVMIASPPGAVWPLVSDPAIVASDWQRSLRFMPHNGCSL